MHILVKGTISIANTETVATLNNRTKKVVFKHCALFTECISKINNTQVYNAKDIDVVMPIYYVIEYNDNY